MRAITFTLVVFFLTLTNSVNASEDYYCDINAVQTNDYSEDMLGYYQDDYDRVFPEWLANANSGDKKYQFYVAKAYQYGQGVEKDLYKSFDWYTKSSDQGYAVAKNNLSFFYNDGQILDQNFKKHFQLLCEAATSGLLIAQNNLGLIFFYGDGVELDYQVAFRWFKKSAAQGFADAQNNLGLMYSYGEGVELDYQEAFRWFKKSADQGVADAQNSLGYLYNFGYGVTTDFEQAVNYYRQAAEQGNSWGQFNLGLMYMNGDGIDSDFEMGHYWYEMAAEQGHIDAINNLGLDYMTGIYTGDSEGNKIISNYLKSEEWLKKGVELNCANCAALLYEIYIEKKNIYSYSEEVNLLYNPELAIKYLKLADEMGDESALSMLGSIYLTGNESIPQDLKKALFWFHKSEEKFNDSYSQGQLAFLYSAASGNDEIRDDVASVYWATKASLQGSVQGKDLLANSLQWGNGALQDGYLAIKSYKEITELGENQQKIDALKNIGYIYSNGFTNVPRDFQLAIDFYKQAEQLGDKESRFILGKIYIALSEYDEAEKWLSISETEESDLALLNLKEALNGDAYAQLQIGHLISIFGQSKAAEEWYEKSAINGNSEAQNLMGVVFGGSNFTLDPGEDANVKISLFWLKKAAQQGSAEAQNNLGVAYQNGKGVNIDIEQALYWYELSASQNYSMAMRNLGSIYLSIFDQPIKAIEYYQKAFELGTIAAAWDLGVIYLQGRDGVDVNEKLAFEWMLKGAKSFYMPAQFEVSIMYLDGTGVPIDEKESTFWLMKAYNNNISSHDISWNDLAREELTRRYYYGIGVEKSFKKAKEIDIFYAMELLGDCDINPCSVDDFIVLAEAYQYEYELGQDTNKALPWWIKAANEGSAYAQNTLGLLYSHWSQSAGIQADFLKAEMWFLKAIDQGYLESMAELGMLYYTYNENPGVENPLYNPSKSFNLLVKAREARASNYHMGLHYHYRYGVGTKLDIDKAILIIEEKLINIADQEKDYWMWSLLSIHTEYNISNDESFSLAMNYFLGQAKLGDVKAMNTLAYFYLFDGFKYYDEKEAMYWLNEAKDSSFNANIVLSQYADNYIDYGEYLLKAIDLFESEKNIDYVSNDSVIEAYFSAAAFFRDMGAPEKVESLLRRVSRIIPENEDNPFREILNMTLAGISPDHETSKSYLRDYINKIYGAGQEDLYNTFYALISLHELYLDDGDVKEALDLAKNALRVLNLMDSDGSFLGARITLQQFIAKDYIQLGDFKKASKYFVLLDESINIKFSEEYQQKFERDNTIIENVDIIWRDIIGAIIEINNGSIDEGFEQLSNTLDKVNESDIPLRRHDLDLALVPLGFFTQNGHYDKAGILMSKVIDLYQQGVEKRINYDSIITPDEKDKIRDAISEYVYISSLGSAPLDDQGFEIMQLASGLTLSDTVIKSISSNELSGTLFIKSKVLEQLNNERRQLVDKKFQNLSSGSDILNSIDESLNAIDQQINSLEKDLADSRTNSFDVFLIPLAKVQDNLSNNDALITMLISNQRSYVWLTTQKGVYRHDSELTFNEISLHAQNLTKALDPSKIGNLSFPIDSSSKLYELLISPFEEELKGIDRLIFSPDPILSQIPLSILTKPGEKGFDIVSTNDDLRGISKVKNTSNNKSNKSLFSEVDWLIKDYAISIIPSVYSFVGLEKVAREKGSSLDNFIGIGNPLLSGTEVVLRGDEKVAFNDQRGAISRTIQDLSALPETESELNTIAKFFNESSIITQENATETSVRNMDLSEANVIAFATHALVSNEIDDLFEPAIVLTPVDSDNPENDGLLQASEVSELNLNADIVLLSACNTASSFDESNSQGLSGLADSFFEAGAKSLLASYWSVISDSAVDITTRMFERTNTGKTYSHKHRQSVLEILNEPNSYKSNPVYWAPFMVVGVN